MVGDEGLLARACIDRRPVSLAEGSLVSIKVILEDDMAIGASMREDVGNNDPSSSSSELLETVLWLFLVFLMEAISDGSGGPVRESFDGFLSAAVLLDEEELISKKFRFNGI